MALRCLSGKCKKNSLITNSHFTTIILIETKLNVGYLADVLNLISSRLLLWSLKIYGYVGYLFYVKKT